ncbi:dynein axonemal assembly factor 1 homolog [Metopolophium dirhodum]|uniref:dynein axonemal assembly factor 1 homolog n=1 Tax=Metopolophium dirhodum TaxID=44670 RepID=UPI00298F6AC7|nr:dynein axonemal assembly factor 1 homolog [Metopolophium dirhodum]
MESLRVLSLTGNSVISKIKNYRKTLTIKCKELRNLDERPIFKKDRLCAEAWSTGGIEAEQAMRTKLNEVEQKTISDSVNALMSMRRNRNVQITPSAFGDSGHWEGVDVRDSTDSLIVSKDYYNECDSSDDDSTDDGSSVKDANPLVREINGNNDGGDGSAAADGSVDRSTRDNVGHNDKGLSDAESDIVDYPRDRMPAGDRSTCITTVDCSSGYIDTGHPPIITVAEDGDELAERLDEKCEHFVDSKTDASPNNVETNNTVEPSLEQCTDDRLCSNESAELTIEYIENEFVSAEMNYANDELNPDESGKLDDENSNKNYNNKNVVNNHYRNVGGSIEINNTLKDNDSETCKNSDLNERQGVEGLPLLCSEQIINTSQILYAERSHTLDIIGHDNAEEESSLTTTCKSDRSEIKAIPIQLPWLLTPQIKEEFHIKKSSE